MGFLSNLFGGSKSDDGHKALKDAFALIQRVLEDEAFQLEFVHPAIRKTIESGPIYDKNPKGSGPFGFVDTNPIPVNGPIGELAYLSRLETLGGQRLLFHRLGSIGTIDAFEAVSFDGKEWFILFADFYHPKKSRVAPEGLRFTKDLAQFSGFTSRCENFPYDFMEKKSAQPSSPVSLAYIAMSKIAPFLQAKVCNRPLAHRAKLDLVMSRVSGMVAASKNQE